MKSSDAKPSSKEIPNSWTLEVKGLGHIPALKNSMYAIVDKEKRLWKKKCVQLFASQLFSALKTTESGILTPQFLRSLIHSLPYDDSWKDIPELHVTCQKVPKGQAGALITIERI